MKRLDMYINYPDIIIQIKKRNVLPHELKDYNSSTSFKRTLYSEKDMDSFNAEYF